MGEDSKTGDIMKMLTSCR